MAASSKHDYKQNARWLHNQSVQAFRRYQKLNIVGKLFVWFLILFHVALAYLLFIFGPSNIAQKLYDLAQELRNYRFGWLILGTFMVITSYPPLVGYSTSVSLCGFAYGIKGFLLAGSSAILGSAIVFITLRLMFKQKLQSWTRQNVKWQALETVIRAKGLPLIILIRLSPFPPWVYSNAMFASIEAVALWQFVIATLCTLPKLLLTVFIGSRIAQFSDGETRGQMDPTTKIINIVSIVLGISIGLGTGWLVYRLMQAQIRKLHESSDESDELAADALEEAEEGAPLLRNISPDSVDVVIHRS
ncbi:Golgi apparatus membrane protein TVP38 [Rickenella mellea]|uniref:Golgi apparatus membrane protein TVP38 n=1 Tax=Rickenella mellea TaxID=50990 RepID=A0A4R5XEI4_9AGAM|nr:Golgi apparatus membrane protein TVP38 [Rickenella mellea]